MKKYIIILGLLICTFSCKKETIPMFDTPGGVHFSDTLWTYSFISDPEATSTVVKIPVKVFGKTAPHDRVFNVELLEGDTARVSTLPADKYELLKCFVPADSTHGEVPVRVDYYDEMDNEVKLLFLRIAPNDEFPNTDFRGRKMRLEVTNKIIQPANWNNSLRYYFGMHYSTAWWRFILKATDRTDLPYWPGENATIWWMDDYEFQANVDLVKNELEKYNADHPNDKLKHDDGPQAGKEITM